MKKKIIGSSIGTVIGLFLLAAAIAAALQSASASNNNCVDIDCLKQKLRLACEKQKSEYLDCVNILRCIDAGEQEIMSECVKAYPAENESSSCNSQDLLLRSWCDYIRRAIPK